ncbi:hypothetical protein BpHYR1_016085 [Brachionus plicatilis]|uniref:Uncharacterized protein n=1 Tax=Brachionus plicatilis TaxID=10195 RepID=A0A3M7SLT4_BRAPC|nr:hypothetical protein BpHYR1_016085 [Brachionus plicatilis]
MMYETLFLSKITMRLPNKIFLSELKEGKRNLGRLLLRYKETVKSIIEENSLDMQSKHFDSNQTSIHTLASKPFKCESCSSSLESLASSKI